MPDLAVCDCEHRKAKKKLVFVFNAHVDLLLTSPPVGTFFIATQVTFFAGVVHPMILT